jgi:hypothetical protein
MVVDGSAMTFASLAGAGARNAMFIFNPNYLVHVFLMKGKKFSSGTLMRKPSGMACFSRSDVRFLLIRLWWNSGARLDRRR